MSRAFRLTAPRASENDVEAGCRTILELHRYYVLRLPAGLFRHLGDRPRYIHGVKTGTPDYACLHEFHRSFLLEVKRPGGKLSEKQKTQIDDIRLRYRLPIVVVESADELSRFLARHEHSP